jgi:hypothetical protein
MLSIMKKIIVPVDFSNHSEFALKTAAVLAKKRLFHYFYNEINVLK